jgi:hypothetical protein
LKGINLVEKPLDDKEIVGVSTSSCDKNMDAKKMMMQALSL